MLAIHVTRPLEQHPKGARSTPSESTPVALETHLMCFPGTLPDRPPFANPENTPQIGTPCPISVVWRDLGVLDFQAVGGLAVVVAAAVKKPEIFRPPANLLRAHGDHRIPLGAPHSCLSCRCNCTRSPMEPQDTNPTQRRTDNTITTTTIT